VIVGWICHNQKTGFTESRLNLICECTRCEPPSNGRCSSVSSKFQNCPLTIITWGYHKHFRWMFDGNNSTSSKQHFLPRTTQVNYIIAWENLRITSSSSSGTSNFSDPPLHKKNPWCKHQQNTECDLSGIQFWQAQRFIFLFMSCNCSFKQLSDYCLLFYFTLTLHLLILNHKRLLYCNFISTQMTYFAPDITVISMPKIHQDQSRLET